MARGFDRSGWWIAALLGALLAALGWLQYQWLGALGRAERARAAAGLASGAEAVARDVDRMLSQAALVFLSPVPEGAEASAAALSRWRAEARYPQLVRAVWRTESEGDGRALRIDGASGRIEERTLPEALRWRHGDRGAGARFRRSPHRFRHRGLVPPGLRDRPPAIYLPGRPPERITDGRPPASVLVELDQEVLTGEVLPGLIDRYLPPLGGVALSVIVERLSDGTVVFASGPPLSRQRADAETELFRLQPVPALGGSGARRAPEASGPRYRPHGRTPFWERMLLATDPPRWRMRVAHPRGSIDAQVAAARRRNMAVASGVLAVLAGSVVLLTLSARRSRALADQRLALVAAVTHELRTPLAAVRSAGANLADDVVTARDQVRRYGRMIEAEGSRLSRLVEQTLLYAGALAGGTVERTSVSLPALVGAVVDERRGLLEEAGMAVTVRGDDDLPVLVGDRDALARAVDNLVVNAVRHAAAGGRLDLDLSRRGSAVVLAVADRGPGIAGADRGRVFEPFFRGTDARAGGPGTGIGLAVVRAVAEAHGGTVAVAARDGGGAVFTLRLPIGAEPAPAGIVGAQPAPEEGG